MQTPRRPPTPSQDGLTIIIIVSLRKIKFDLHFLPKKKETPRVGRPPLLLSAPERGGAGDESNCGKGARRRSAPSFREVRDALAGRGLDARRSSALPLNSRPTEREGRLHRMAGIAGMTPLRAVIPRGSRCTRSSRQKGRTTPCGRCDLFGGNKRARTSDPLLVRQMLSQLSYAPG